MPQPDDAVAVVRDLHVEFTRNGRKIYAVRGVDLEIAAGEILGLVGESGSGKSVMSLALLGLLPEALAAGHQRRGHASPAPTC